MDLARKLVVDCLLKVEASGFSNLVLLSEIDSHSLANQDKAFVTKLFYGTVERKLTLNYILQKQLSKPIAKMDREIVAILQSGLYLEQSFLILIKLNLIRNYKFLHYIDDI